MWDVTLAAFSDELVKIGASVDALQKAYGRLGSLRVKTRLGATVPNAPEQLIRQLAARGPSTSPRKKQLVPLIKRRLSGLTETESTRVIDAQLRSAAGAEGQIVRGKGGAIPSLKKIDMSQRTPGAANKFKQLSGPGQRATNIVAGLHEGYERGAKNVAPIRSHISPDVMLKEHNLLRGMTGEGAGEAREALQGLRSGPGGEASTLREILKGRYGDAAASNFVFGSPGAPKITKAMRKDLARNVSASDVDAAAKRATPGRVHDYSRVDKPRRVYTPEERAAARRAIDADKAREAAQEAALRKRLLLEP